MIRFLEVDLFSALFSVTIPHSCQKSNGIRRVFAKVLSPLYQSVSVCVDPYRSVSVLSDGSDGSDKSDKSDGSDGFDADACLPPTGKLTGGTFKRCRRRISGTYRTYETYRTRMTEWQTLFLLIFCGAAPALRLPPGAEVSRRKFVFWQGDDEGAD